MFGKLGMFFNAFKIGEQVLNPEAWKAGAIDANKIVMLLTVLLGIAKAYGINIDMDTGTIGQVGIGLFALINWVVHLVTSRKVGLPVRSLVGVQQVADSVQQRASDNSTAQTEQAVPSNLLPSVREAEALLDAARGRQLTESEMATNSN